MKLKINKACDLSSVSVLPPHNRRPNGGCAAPSASILGGGTGGQLSMSQQSFSQGAPSQPGGALSQFSQSSIDEYGISDQRYSSQERENSAKRISYLVPVSHSREDSQQPFARSSNKLMHRWSSNSPPDYKCQVSEELEQRIALIETSLTRFGTILDATQSDVMQINKGTKEISLETEGIRQKSSTHDNSLHLLNRGQEDIKASVAAAIKLITDEFSKNAPENKLQESLSIVSALPEQINVCLQKLKADICKSLSDELQALTSGLKASIQKNPTPAILSPKVTGSDSSSHMPHKIKSEAVKAVNPPPVTTSAKIETRSWICVKDGQGSLMKTNSCKPLKQRRTSPTEQMLKSVNETNEDLDADFSCLLVGERTDMGNNLIKEAKERTERILRKARRRKRKHWHVIVID